jgi:ATP-binding cassette subfamily C (CFTR/MRP) protein 1
MTLMGTDVERIAETWYLLVVESWANILQLGIAIFLLERQLGAVCIAPILIAVGTHF